MTNKQTNELDAQTKGRITRLSKKTSDELINIILRKDSVEKKYVEKIKSQATELSRAYASISSYKEEVECLEKDSENLNGHIKELNKVHQEYVTESIKDYEDIDKKYRGFKALSIILGIISCTLLICVLYMI